MGKFSPWLLRSWLQKVRSRYTRPPRFLIWTHQNFYKGKNGETRSQKLSQPSWLDTRRGLNWPTVWSTDWLTDSLSAWLTDWLTNWLSDWLIDQLTDQLTDWLTDWLIDQSTDWLTDEETNGWRDGEMGGWTDRLTDWRESKTINKSFNQKPQINWKETQRLYLFSTYSDAHIFATSIQKYVLIKIFFQRILCYNCNSCK